MDNAVVALGTWLLDHRLVLLGGVAGLVLLMRGGLSWQRRRNEARLGRVEQAGLGISDRELELAIRLLQTLHLSVAERQELAGGTMRFSALVCAARAELARHPFLPSHLRPHDRFDGVVIERRDDDYVVHKQNESGVGRFGPKYSLPVQDLKDAIYQYLSLDRESKVDGVRIDRER